MGSFICKIGACRHNNEHNCICSDIIIGISGCESFEWRSPPEEVCNGAC